MLYHMYRRPITPLDRVPALPAGFRLECWRPSLGCPVHPRLRGVPFLAWSLFHFARVFATRDYMLLLLFRDATLVHRTCLLPAHFRFPFMAAGDLQAAGLWTAPAFRGRGLGLLALGEVLRRLQDPGRILWYMARLDNLPSIRLAEKAGFVPYGRVARRKRLASHLLGAFHLEALYRQPGAARDTIPS